MTTEVAVRAEGLSKSYRGWRRRENWALRDCTFELPRGQVTALVGANGAGKSTLLGMLAGLLDPAGGTVDVAGRTAFVAQDKPVYKQLTAPDMLRLAARLNETWDQRRATRWLDRFEVPADRRCARLSGGQRAQVAFAVALGARPDVLLLDEPLSNLDPLARREVMTELLAETADAGMAVVLSTHVVAELGGVADRLLLLARGRLVADGEVDRLLGEHLHYVGPRADEPPGPGEVIEARHEERQSTFLVRLAGGTPVVAEPWITRPVTLEDLVLARLAASRKEAA
ncbi:ABC transporter ATP-binding protein [Amycolatopsis suaedae]|uniref:ABC transporter ATP-binding protein n=1 Tax=Amycolatopsis suaedae TaxID=2510978 RepID=A0A4Q7J679_9PSEU|nr:ABC transporter ATP-binding protein [Amycolatopsis suaedae]RZQ62388.1 ABC transporter ATP-binding protein [Amycolatopsis suaedae]